MGEGGKTILGRTKTKELMEDKVECKDGITPFGSLILRSMQGCCISIALNNSSFASFLLIPSSFLFNSSSCLTLSFSSYFFLFFSSFFMLNFSFIFHSSSSLSSFSNFSLFSCAIFSFSTYSLCFLIALCFSISLCFSNAFCISNALCFSNFSFSLFLTQEQVQFIFKISFLMRKLV